MHLARHQVRASSGSYRQFTTSNGPLLILPRSASNRLLPPLQSSCRRPLSSSGRGPTLTMFQRAANRYPAAPAAPLQSTLGARSNSSAAPLHKPVAPAAAAASSLGVKRKIEMTSTPSTLGSLHDEVYFDENDFDDDEDLDFEAPDPFTRPVVTAAATVAAQIARPPKISKQQPQKQEEEQEEDMMAGYPNLSSAFVDDKISVVDLTETPTRDTASAVKYPDLPPMPVDDNQPPSSSIQYPWSSSPPSHFQAPAKKPRKLPWLGEEDEEDMGPRKSVTPARPKQTAIWNKSASAIKDEQRELRRQNKEMKALVTGQLPPPRAQVASIFLSDEQRHVLDAVVQQGKSIFFTGSAGTGKSVLMREIIKKLRDKYKREPDRVAVTASTGLAACNIEGVTLHSFAGIGLGKEPVPELVKKVSV
ncbi:hypothetical protein BO99DRAFT_191420 [Aspergillus violaceofuscus CBS 115571]|uniref:ATP-dependent DNA helicase n=1 Tax=Aspergillus violaceofuscus (strain CBS 115571) TaxID=1450538 RepID=A0A2V5H249_ASPV1|nr:hypothetical protein BO99DRAFT_191420 [Aspergillus violaceofuscus CBS 115571]